MKRSGFTTIEMIMVVVIMGVIATIGFPRIRDALEKQSRLLTDEIIQEALCER